MVMMLQLYYKTMHHFASCFRNLFEEAEHARPHSSDIIDVLCCCGRVCADVGSQVAAKLLHKLVTPQTALHLCSRASLASQGLCMDMQRHGKLRGHNSSDVRP